jgi:hypothetical protein
MRLSESASPCALFFLKYLQQFADNSNHTVTISRFLIQSEASMSENVPFLMDWWFPEVSRIFRLKKSNINVSTFSGLPCDPWVKALVSGSVP